VVGWLVPSWPDASVGGAGGSLAGAGGGGGVDPLAAVEGSDDS
jgi:hypothetical protein